VKLDVIHSLIAITKRRQKLHREGTMCYAEDLQMRKTSDKLCKAADVFIRRMTSHQFWYIASPYSASTPKTRKRRYEAVADITNKLYDRGIICWSPIATWHPLELLNDRLRPPEEYTRLNDTMLFQARGLICIRLPGHEQSKGLAHERRRNLSWNRPCVEFTPGPYFKDPNELIDGLVAEIKAHE
jgi:hypothetical protein